ncbi:MAG: hypothetical protein GTO45_05140 [Candidatus Aminicenantes bacterium]|nr:hypothetical protein [Candidatus Aminicenantes bacterium]NIM78136.1 hypothetical protein [Candidatus Aminicenantes bacterium]NIN17456.1 hypothetical protein [Candidatus Aminicenantes bacterium]NIN41352.1 hypothetical protein [Candidatus Aminicenantes bacterium]NIN84122.1 hypothetical protein [Candidatus Aminicenantes bacterium]
MSQIEFVESLVKPLVQSGVYKDEASALKAIVIDYIDRKKTEYDDIISRFEKKYKRDFKTFTKDIANRATVEIEDDWMEWKGAIEMRKG